MRIAINGFGRIGRCIIRAAYERSLLSDQAPFVRSKISPTKTLSSKKVASTNKEAFFEIVAINELADPATIAYLTQYDSTHGRFPAAVDIVESKNISHLNIKGEQGHCQAQLYAKKNIAQLPWAESGVDWVLECTGEVKTREKAMLHLQQGVKGVLLSNPGESDIPVAVMGVNDGFLSQPNGELPKVISAASCTSNALIPALSVLHKHFGIEGGVITTIHAAMHDQPVIDAYHGDDLRKNRASSQSFIPVQTELAAGIGRVLPELAGRFVAQAIRVPVSNVSALNVTLNLSNDVTKSSINQVLDDASRQYPKDVLSITTEPLASCDFVHHPCSGTIDASQTQVVNKRSVNLLIWFDNEWAFVNRMLDILQLIEGA